LFESTSAVIIMQMERVSEKCSW